jgi:hypothetical protein
MVSYGQLTSCYPCKQRRMPNRWQPSLPDVLLCGKHSFCYTVMPTSLLLTISLYSGVLPIFTGGFYRKPCLSPQSFKTNIIDLINKHMQAIDHWLHKLTILDFSQK